MGWTGMTGEWQIIYIRRIISIFFNKNIYFIFGVLLFSSLIFYFYTVFYLGFIS